MPVKVKKTKTKQQLVATSEAKRVHDSHRKKTAVAILPCHIFISSLIMKPIHCAHNGLPEWMNATVLFMTQYPFRAGKTEQRGEKCRTQVTISTPVSEVTLLFGAVSLSRGVFTLRRVWVLLHSSCVCLLLVRAGFHIPVWLADSQLLFVFVALMRESGYGRNIVLWEQPLTYWWNMGFNWQLNGHKWDVCPESSG